MLPLEAALVKEIKKHRDYFVRNHDRMQYAAFEKQHLPLGSGEVERLASTQKLATSTTT